MGQFAKLACQAARMTARMTAHWRRSLRLAAEVSMTAHWRRTLRLAAEVNAVYEEKPTKKM